MTGLVMLGAFIAVPVIVWTLRALFQVALWTLRALFGASKDDAPDYLTNTRAYAQASGMSQENVDKCMAAGQAYLESKANGGYARKQVAHHQQAMASASSPASNPDSSRGGSMKIRCQSCGNTEKTSVGLIVKLVGGAMPVGGF